MDNHKKIQSKISFFVILCAFFAISFFNLNPDFGFHLQTGNYYLARGIPNTDIFTYTASDFPWVNHAWLSDVVIASLYKTGGYLLVAVFFSLIWTISLFLADHFRNWPAVFLTAVGLSPYVGIRPMAFTVLFTVILISLLRTKNRKNIFIIPALFALWANLHGGFPIGFLILAYYLIFKRRFHLNKTIFLSILFTFINPFSARLYREVGGTLLDNSLRFLLAEWVPAFFKLSTIIYLAWYLGFALNRYLLYPSSIKNMYPSKSPKNPLDKIFSATHPTRRIKTALLYQHQTNSLKISHIFTLPLIFFGLILSSNRHFPLFAVVALPSLRNNMRYFWQTVSQNKNPVPIAKIKRLISSIIIITCIIGLSFTVAPLIKNYPHQHYPREAVAYLHHHPCSGNLFNSLGLGGYLIWQLPGTPLYIDGRMASWRGPENTNYIANYIKIHKDDSFRESEFKKHNITCALIKKDELPESTSLIQKLEENGWQKNIDTDYSTLLLSAQ